MARRGPDDEGYENWPAASLGHRRLSIFHLSSAGAQPMTMRDRTVGIVFNGAIYNFPELRAELEAVGCQFRSRSDTEVLLQGYREWGVERLVDEEHRSGGLVGWVLSARRTFNRKLTDRGESRDR